jgi:hypothetical protein
MTELSVDSVGHDIELITGEISISKALQSSAPSFFLGLCCAKSEIDLSRDNGTKTFDVLLSNSPASEIRFLNECNAPN